MGFDIVELDPTLPDTLTTLLPVLRAASAADSPRHPEPTEAWLRLIYSPRVARHRGALAAYDGDVLVGYGVLNQELDSNRDLIFGDLWVLPEYRAAATAPLLDAFQSYGRARGGRRLVLSVSEFAAADYEPVIAAAGGRQVSAERRSQLDLATVDREQYAAWAAPSEKNAHYRIQAWVVPTPEHLLAAAETAADAMRDAPTGDLQLEHREPSVEHRRAAEALIVAAGHRKHIVAAVTDDGVIAGFHEMFVIPGFPMADVGNTGVPKAFRGHGLGLRLKAAMTLRLLDAEPEVETISTWNDADNAPMLRVNDSLGYVQTEAWSIWQFEL